CSPGLKCLGVVVFKLELIKDAESTRIGNQLQLRFYQMCLSNFHNRFSTMQVFLSFGVYYDNQNSSKDTERDMKEEELNNTLSFIQAATSKVERHIFHMFRYYSFSRMRRSADHFLLQSNSRYITWWSMALSLVIVTSGYLQLLFLKSLFVSKAEAEKPRC
uniref:GOLD domain-containing protein n=1 Tax=Poecilia mexicana TaxID=48701 RepID=A0A3B3XYX9_9TELE